MLIDGLSTQKLIFSWLYGAFWQGECFISLSGYVQILPEILRSWLVCYYIIEVHLTLFIKYS